MLSLCNSHRRMSCCAGIYTCRSGSAADTQAISDYVRLYLSHYTSDTGKEPSVKVAAHLFKSMCYNNKDRLTAGIICGGALRADSTAPGWLAACCSRAC
jgi:20S proteasome alpha/beta subunit